MSSQFRYDGRIQATSGFAIPGVSIAVLTQPAVTTSQPGSPLATLFAAATSNAATITAASWLAGVISFTFNAVPADVVAGSYIGVSGVNPSGYNGIWQVVDVTGNVVRVTTPFTLAAIANPGAYVAAGTVATSALPNPFLTDTLGNFAFYAAAGIYTVQIYDTAGRLPSQLVLADQNVVAGGGSGSVTSVALTMPSEFTVTGSPIAGAGTLAVTKATQLANLVFAGPTSGGAAVPTFRGLVAADLPAGGGTVTSVAATLAVPAALLGSSVGGSPITTNGTIAFTLTLLNQNANLIFGGPASGGAAPPTFRAAVPADLAPNIYVVIGGSTPGDQTAKTVAIVSTPLFTPATSGLFQVDIYEEITIAGTGTLQTTITYTDDVGATSITPIGAALSAASLGRAQGSAIIRATAGNAIAFTTAFGTGTYSVYIRVRALT